MKSQCNLVASEVVIVIHAAPVASCFACRDVSGAETCHAIFIEGSNLNVSLPTHAPPPFPGSRGGAVAGYGYLVGLHHVGTGLLTSSKRAGEEE